MAEPVKLVTLGGLTYNANLVEKAEDNGNGTFTVSFKSGEKLTYPQQSGLIEKPKEKQLNGDLIPDGKGGMFNTGIYDKVNPRIEQRIDKNMFYDDTYFDISNVIGATFTSHRNNVSHVNLENCIDTTVDLAHNGSRYYGDSVKITGGKGNEAILDEQDKATVVRSTYEEIIKGRGVANQDNY